MATDNRGVGALALGLMCTLALGACGSDADKLAGEGVDALAECDIRTAHDKFAAAYDADSSHPQAALGFALTDLALLPEDPEVTAALADLGFTGPIDMQVLVFGPEGVLARYARGDTCDSIELFADANIPYPPLTNDTIDANSLIRSDATVGDFLAHAVALSPRLGRIAEALEAAAAGLPEPVAVEGGCGLGQVTFQAPELYAAAALIEALRGVLQYARAYDWDINVQRWAAGDEAMLQTVVDELNAHFLHLDDAGAAGGASDLFARALTLAGLAVDAARPIQGPVDGGLFDWSLMPDVHLDDARSLVDSVSGALEAPTPIADVTPALTLDGASVFDAPFDLAGRPPMFSVASDEFGSWMTTDTTSLEAAVGDYFSPSPWGPNAPSFTWAADDRWATFDGDPVVQPARRYETIYQCATATP